MIRRIAICSIAAALFALAGGHWGVLQTVAWANMIREYSQDSGVVDGLLRTFDGQNPCSLCERIEEESSQDTQTPMAMAAALKFEVVFSTAKAVPAASPRGNVSYAWPDDERADGLPSAPDAPVPIVS